MEFFDHHFAWGVLAGFAGSEAANWAQRWARRKLLADEDILTGFMRRFPGKCPICSYHRHGLRNGNVPADSEPSRHVCLENS